MSYNEPPPPPPPGYGNAPETSYGGQPAGTSSKAIWSLVTGIVSLFFCGIVLGIVAIVLSRSATSDIARTGQGGAGMAKAGLVVGAIGLALNVLLIIALVTGSLSI